ncbi:NAD(P)/FAD-dependent oxidoreductase [Micromonospora sp. LAH09]|uniref:NAD(P)/FAD-dependent oxidoreductase n=1 Tax=Micromonospora cabrerizensis TaxID=2911213 RepID=UPI001EE7DA67|nr:NAD(P)/FAD-dependent oxidoreductase [Micromonospora cabrerizensis]MCG5468734.1 NAD(P)/FAD-dependent oxidoreductase [Micromonospora cabrerizensis]
MRNFGEQAARAVDVVIIGGGAAGLSGALILARSLRSVVVIDAGQPRNAPADGVHGLLAREGTPPAELLAAGRDEVQRYGGEIVTGSVSDARRDEEWFAVTLTDGTRLRARRLLIATGLVDVLPDVAGLAQQWGHDVVHCPYCHGYEVRGRAIGILATGAPSVHHALLFRQLSADLVYFTHHSELTEEQEEQFAALGIDVVTGEVAAAEAADGNLTGLRMADGRVVPREVIAVATRMEARAGFLSELGLNAVEHPSGMGHHLPADQFGRSQVPGVWLAGNVTDLTAQVGAAAAAGATAGQHLNADLVAEDTRAAVERHRTNNRQSAARNQP